MQELTRPKSNLPIDPTESSSSKCVSEVLNTVHDTILNNIPPANDNNFSNNIASSQIPNPDESLVLLDDAATSDDNDDPVLDDQSDTVLDPSLNC